MSNQSNTAETKKRGTTNWILGGAIGGVVGSLTFGLVLWVVDPTIITETVPAVYGVEPMGTAGWIFHLLHGLILGLIFGFIISRKPVQGSLMTSTDMDALDGLGTGPRVTLAGFVYGLAVWALLPLALIPVRLAVGGFGEPGFPFFAFESLVGHALYGLFLGSIFAVVTETSVAETVDSPFDETETPSRREREREQNDS
ncbi:hypothetical protein [Natronolimnobius baerhuensis]|uniref:Histidine kinase n=1 Tax=Natronolimnobius baerhuensis TaxID=253108 RepID=A0A202E6T2_9EURY|nr:hypothetical protein [Natronolimnobius baerhuensis]OVE83965.1 hypothetical protein B2G88_16290 [Natronolimnobius baerhuensis]